MAKVWAVLVAFVKLLYYNLTTATETIRQEKLLREAADKQAAELEAEILKAVEEAAKKDAREGTEVLASDNPGDGAADFLRDSFPKDN